MEVTKLSDEQKAEFKEAMSGIYVDVKADVGEELFNKLMKEVSKKHDVIQSSKNAIHYTAQESPFFIRSTILWKIEE